MPEQPPGAPATITAATYTDVAPYARLAAREHVSVKPDQGTRWWTAHTPTGLLVAFAGLWEGPRLQRFKGAWTRPDFRGHGIGHALVHHVLAHTDPARTLEVIHVAAGDPDFWPRHGLTYHATRPNGGRVYRRPPA